MTPEEIDPKYIEYLHDELGYSKRKIQKAWKKANEDFPKDKHGLLVREVVTRDILRGEYHYGRSNI